MKLRKNIIFKFLFINYLILNLIHANYVENNNSIYKISNNPRSNSLGGLHLLSENVGGIFKQPLKINTSLNYL